MRILALISVITLCFNFTSLAQTLTPTIAFSYFTVSGTSSNGFFKVVLPATTGINSIKVRLGTTMGVYDLVDYAFAFDVTTGLPAGYSYLRTDKECLLGVGTFTEPPTCFGEVLLQDSSGTWGDPLQFLSN